jgi:hypothetical protein
MMERRSENAFVVDSSHAANHSPLGRRSTCATLLFTTQPGRAKKDNIKLVEKECWEKLSMTPRAVPVQHPQTLPPVFRLVYCTASPQTYAELTEYFDEPPAFPQPSVERVW